MNKAAFVSIFTSTVAGALCTWPSWLWGKPLLALQPRLCTAGLFVNAADAAARTDCSRCSLLALYGASSSRISYIFHPHPGCRRCLMHVPSSLTLCRVVANFLSALHGVNPAGGAGDTSPNILVGGTSMGISPPILVRTFWHSRPILVVLTQWQHLMMSFRLKSLLCSKIQNLPQNRPYPTERAHAR